MPETIIPRPDIAEGHAQAVNERFNSAKIVERQADFGIKPTPIYFYNVGPLEHSVPRYPNHPHMYLRGCPKDKPWILCRGNLQHPFEEKRFDQNGNPFIVFTDGFVEATKCLNPQNPGTNQDWDSPDALNVNDNLNALGVFWSANYPPSEEEIAAARRRMEKTFTAELEVMVAEESKSPEAARQRANNISHAAASYYGQSYSWHRSDLTRASADANKTDCQVCGEKVQPKAKICIHCGCPDPALEESEKRDKWVERKFRAPGRPALDKDE